MIDIKLLRENMNYVVASLEKRKKPQPFLDVDKFKRLDSERKILEQKVNELRKERNSLSREIGRVKRTGGDSKQLESETAAIKVMLPLLEVRLKQLDDEIYQMMLRIPALPHESVPVGCNT